MESAGCRILFRLTELAVMGLFDVIPLLWRFYRLVRAARRHLAENRPDAVVLVDYPGFNWWIARAAKKLGIPVFYYLPPQLWAWAPWRIRKIRRFIDHVLCGLPFEHAWYRERGIAAELVGHPFFDEVADRRLDEAFLAGQMSTRPQAGPIVAILPGSRNHEIRLNFPNQLQVMAELHRRFPDARFLVACYKESQRESCATALAGSSLKLPVELHVGRTSEIIALARVCLMVSGSVSLELLARRTPAVVLYRVGRLNAWIGRLLVTCPYISLPNLIAGRPVMPEFVITGESSSDVSAIIDLLDGWLADPARHAAQVAALDALARATAEPGATARAAETIIAKLCGSPAHTRAA
jgi:lipid-A-disaccharide synthase